jgi:hypothetical protein
MDGGFQMGTFPSDQDNVNPFLNYDAMRHLFRRWGRVAAGVEPQPPYENWYAYNNFAMQLPRQGYNGPPKEVDGKPAYGGLALSQDVVFDFEDDRWNTSGVRTDVSPRTRRAFVTKLLKFLDEFQQEQVYYGMTPSKVFFYNWPPALGPEKNLQDEANAQFLPFVQRLGGIAWDLSYVMHDDIKRWKAERFDPNLAYLRRAFPGVPVYTFTAWDYRGGPKVNQYIGDKDWSFVIDTTMKETEGMFLYDDRGSRRNGDNNFKRDDPWWKVLIDWMKSAGYHKRDD